MGIAGNIDITAIIDKTDIWQAVEKPSKCHREGAFSDCGDFELFDYWDTRLLRGVYPEPVEGPQYAESCGAECERRLFYNSEER